MQTLLKFIGRKYGSSCRSTCKTFWTYHGSTDWSR